jgi:hypothetical protein
LEKIYQTLLVHQKFFLKFFQNQIVSKFNLEIGSRAGKSKDKGVGLGREGATLKNGKQGSAEPTGMSTSQNGS